MKYLSARCRPAGHGHRPRPAPPRRGHHGPELTVDSDARARLERLAARFGDAAAARARRVTSSDTGLPRPADRRQADCRHQRRQLLVQRAPGRRRPSGSARTSWTSGGNNDVVAREFALDAAARDAGVTIVPDCGLAPGLAGILGYWLTTRLAQTGVVAPARGRPAAAAAPAAELQDRVLGPGPDQRVHRAGGGHPRRQARHRALAHRAGDRSRSPSRSANSRPSRPAAAPPRCRGRWPAACPTWTTRPSATAAIATICGCSTASGCSARRRST